MTDILLTFTGFHDPYSKGLIESAEQTGPILSLLSIRSFERVCLFDTPATREITTRTAEAISRLHPGTEVRIEQLDISDPTDYRPLLRGIRRQFRQVDERTPDARYYIAVASGTPQMHACWLLLVASGEIPGRILHIRPPRFVTKDCPAVNEVDLCFREFPQVRFSSALDVAAGDGDIAVDQAVAQLGIVGDHPLMHRAIETAALLAPSRAPILILGETGTGKEMFAQLVHKLGGRGLEPFVALNCSAIPPELAESLLFGHRRGAFTGAVADQVGKFTAANKGTLFLDELAELPPSAQSKLLRVIQDGIIEPLGCSRGQKVDVRLVGATHRDLRRMVRQGKFREDLYYRLNVGAVRLPALRERRSDIPKLALSILDRLNQTLRHPRRLTPEALERLQGHDWPGNVRELQNTIERSALLSRNDVISADDIRLEEDSSHSTGMSGLPEPHEGFRLEDFLGRTREQLFRRAVEASAGNQSRAARLLGVTPQAVHKFLQSTRGES